jgi:glyoxylase-like metal-dependent hydrolase (beta-lactamase superfamily II)
MHLEKINGNSYYIPAPANIGVFQFKDKYALLVDSGDNKQQARKIDEILKEHRLSVKYIVNTHNHIDHSGGNGYFQECSPGMKIFASADEKRFIEENQLFPLYLYGGKAPHELSRHFIKSPTITVTDILSPGLCKINEENFEIIPLPGHSPGQIGIASRDSVCYLGDALFSEAKIAKYSLPFLFDVAAQLETYQTLSTLHYDYFVLGHADAVYDPLELKQLIEINRSNLQEYLDLTMEILNQPKTREELLEEISILKDLQLDFKEYYFSFSTIGAMISYLFDKKLLAYRQEFGKLYYYLK